MTEPSQPVDDPILVRAVGVEESLFYAATRLQTLPEEKLRAQRQSGVSQSNLKPNDNFHAHNQVQPDDPVQPNDHGRPDNDDHEDGRNESGRNDGSRNDGSRNEDRADESSSDGRNESGLASGLFRNRTFTKRKKAPPIEPELLAKLAENYGLKVVAGARSLSSLEPTDFPVLLVFDAQRSLLLLGLTPDGDLECQCCDDQQTIDPTLTEKLDHCKIYRLDAKRLTEERDDDLDDPKTVVLQAITRSKRTMGAVIVASVLANLFVLAVPLFTMAVYDRVVPHVALETLWALATGVTVVLILDFAVRTIKQQMLDEVGSAASKELQGNILRRLIGMKVLDRPNEPGTLARSFSELEQLCASLPVAVAAVLVDLPFFMFFLVLIASLAGPVAIAPLVGALILAGGTFLFRYWSRPLHSLAAQSANKRGNFVVELQSILPWVKLTGAETQWRNNWSKLIDRSRVQTENAMRIERTSQAFSTTIGQIVTIAVLVVGVYMIAEGVMSVGALVACSLLAGRSMAPVIAGIGAFQRASEALANLSSISDVWQVAGEKPGDPDMGTAQSIRGNIAVKNLVFQYPEANGPAVQELNLIVNQGEKIAIIGRNGSGKTTLMKLMTRLFEPTAGGILIDGHDARQYEPAYLRKMIAFAPQEPWLFQGSLRANLMAGLADPDEDLVKRVLGATGLLEFISEHPNGLGHKLSMRGDNLSSGQRHSVLLSRALLSDAPVLLLDEPTSHLDQTREHRLIAELASMGRDKTLIIATHRLALLSIVDRVIWMERGRIVMDKPRDQAIAALKNQSSPPASETRNSTENLAVRKTDSRANSSPAQPHTQGQPSASKAHGALGRKDTSKPARSDGSDVIDRDGKGSVTQTQSPSIDQVRSADLSIKDNSNARADLQQNRTAQPYANQPNGDAESSVSAKSLFQTRRDPREAPSAKAGKVVNPRSTKSTEHSRRANDQFRESRHSGPSIQRDEVN